MVAVDSTAVQHISIGDSEPVKNRICILSAVEKEAAMVVFKTTLAVDNAVLRAVFTTDGDHFSFEVNIAVTIAGIGAIPNNNNIPLVRIVNRRLDVVEIRLPIVIDVDYLCLTRDGSAEGGQANKSKNQFTHLNTLLKGPVSDSILP
jgi:hypothetical protein